MNKETSIDVLYDIALDKLKAQLHQVDALDTKVGVIFALANGLTIALLATVVLLARPVPWYVVLFASLAGAAYLVALFPLYKAYKVTGWDYGPDLPTLQQYSLNPDYHDHPQVLKEWVIDECVRAYAKHNKPNISTKSLAASWAIVAVSIQALMLVATAISSLVT